MGELHGLAPRQILKISNVFISHTHVDHFIGFDHLLRICLGRDLHINLFGPPGFIKNIEGKFASYSWNLVENYTNDFSLSVTEIGEHTQISFDYSCRKGFKAENNGIMARAANDNILERRDFNVKTACLDHKIPSLAYRVEEKEHINIMKNNLLEAGLSPGPWLEKLKEGIRNNKPNDMPIVATTVEGGNTAISLGKLKASIVKISAGKIFSYVADARYNPGNIKKILYIADKADTLFIEASFLQEDYRTAFEKYHLTAHQAGSLAREAQVKNIEIFHISPKYKGCEYLLHAEAQEALRGM
jgi:ribonuclease Z